MIDEIAKGGDQKILVVDDDKEFLGLFGILAESEGFHVVPKDSVHDALAYLNSESVDLIISDINMPEITGIQFYNAVQDEYPDIPFIFFTAYGSTENAIEAVKQGAFHYFEKPVQNKLDLIWSTFREALEKRKILLELRSFRKHKILNDCTQTPIIGSSKKMKDVFQAIKEVADIPVTVLLCGETGTGKELVAREIHSAGKRQGHPFFAVNCNEFSSGVLESELFGHERGAFTGAIEQKKGLFEIADKGTLFLDEIGEASLSLQTKLLRVIETRDFTRVGGTNIITSDFRIIAATNKNLEDEIKANRFRQDLYYRLNVYEIKIPPLREREGDIAQVVEYYLKRFNKKYTKTLTGISEKALVKLHEYAWPGNVRELVNVLERAVITAKSEIITSYDLFGSKNNTTEVQSFNLKEMEKRYIKLALEKTNYNKSQAAKILGINRRTLIEKVKKYGGD